MTEQEIASVIMNHYPKMSKLRKATDEFSYFDYENDKYLLEFKSRKTNYPTWIIEYKKLDRNKKLADSVNKDFVYVTEAFGVIYIWNVSKLIRSNYNFNFEMIDAPISSELPNKKNGEMTLKQVGYLDTNDSVKIIV
jgi:hypothetical protein